MTTVVAMVARCRVDSVHVLTMDSAVTGAQLSQYCSCPYWQCLFGSSNWRRSAIKQFDELLSIAVLTALWWILLTADLLLSGSSARYCWILSINRPIRNRRRSGQSSGGLWQSG